MLSLTSLRCFMITAKLMSFSGAAKELYITQQALSHHIAKLEGDLGTKLFVRGNPLELTEAGHVLYKYSCTVFQELDDCSREIEDIKDFRRATLNIGIPATRGTLMLPPLLSAFTQKFPHIQVNLSEGDTPELMTALNESKIDLLIGWLPELGDKYLFTPLYRERFAIIIPNQFLKYVDRVSELSPSESYPITRFSRVPFIAQSSRTKNGRVFEALCNEYDLQPEVVLTTGNILTEIALCMEGMGACVVPYSFILQKSYVSAKTFLLNYSVMNNHTVFLLDTQDIIDEPIIGICRKKGRTLTRAEKEFIEVARSIFSENADET